MHVENCIYLKTTHLNTKNATLAGTEDTYSHTVGLGGEIIQKIKKTGNVHYWTSNNWKSTKKIHKYLIQ